MKRNLLILTLILALPAIGLADRRSYVWTYQYQTIPKGMTELEFYQTTKFKKSVDVWEYRIEVEHGLTERWDLSVYQIFQQAEGIPLRWDAVQFRTRYRLGEEGLWPLDPLVYLEYQRKTESQKQDKLEVKLILAKTFDRGNLAINPVYEFFFAPEGEHEVGLDVGLSWEFHPTLTAGVESTTRVEFGDKETEVNSYFGPTISVASGGWWYTAGVAFGIGGHRDDVRVRFLMGVEL